MLFNCPDPRAGTDDSVALREFIYSAGHNAKAEHGGDLNEQNPNW